MSSTKAPRPVQNPQDKASNQPKRGSCSAFTSLLPANASILTNGDFSSHTSGYGQLTVNSYSVTGWTGGGKEGTFEPDGRVSAFRLVHLGLSELHKSRQPREEAANLLDTQGIELSGVEFRTKANTTAKDRARVETEVLAWIERYLQIELILDLDSAKWQCPVPCPNHLRDVNEAEQLAKGKTLGSPTSNI